MKFKRLLLVSLLAAGLSLNSISTSVAVSWQDQMLQSLNSMRAQKSLKPLEMCKPLTRAAQKYARTMAQQDFLSHTGKDGSDFGERIQSAGYDWTNSKSGSSVAENIAAGQNSVAEVMKGWRNSKGHYKNMIGQNFTHVGFGMSINAQSTYKKYWVQNFGSGASCKS
jgi:uncharacterized protein YkwD